MAPIVSENFNSAVPSFEKPMEKYSTIIDREVDVFLLKIAREFHQDEACFGENFEEFFLQHTMDRLKNTYAKYMRNSKAKLDQLSSAANAIEPAKNMRLNQIKADDMKTPVKQQQPLSRPFGVGFRCCVCFIPFKSRDELMAHRETTKHYPVLSEAYLRTPESRRPVSLFELSPYSDSDDESAIRRKKSPPKPSKCSFCPRQFIQMTYLKKHEETHHAQNNQRKIVGQPIKIKIQPKLMLKCSVCAKEFKSKLNFVKHQQMHANQH